MVRTKAKTPSDEFSLEVISCLIELFVQHLTWKTPLRSFPIGFSALCDNVFWTWSRDIWLLQKKWQVLVAQGHWCCSLSQSLMMIVDWFTFLTLSKWRWSWTGWRQGCRFTVNVTDGRKGQTARQTEQTDRRTDKTSVYDSLSHDVNTVVQ